MTYEMERNRNTRKLNSLKRCGHLLGTYSFPIRRNFCFTTLQNLSADVSACLTRLIKPDKKKNRLYFGGKFDQDT
jgi:hypothetical protein